MDVKEFRPYLVHIRIHNIYHVISISIENVVRSFYFRNFQLTEGVVSRYSA